VNTASELSIALQEAKQKGDFFGTLSSLTPRLGDDDRAAFLKLLASMHNEGAIDLVAEFAELRNEPTSHDFFLTRYIFQGVLPDLNAPADQTARTVVHLVSQAGQDGTSHWPLEAYRAYLDRAPNRPTETLAAIEAESASLALLLPITVAAGFISAPSYFTENVIRLTDSPVAELQRMSLFSFRDVPLEADGTIPPKVLFTLETIVEKADQDGNLAAIVSAAVTLRTRDDSARERLLEVIRKALEQGGDWTLGAAAEVFGLQTKDLDAALLELLSQQLRARVKANTMALQSIDFGVSSLLGTVHCTVALDVLDELLTRLAGSVELKDFSCSISTVASTPELRSLVITRWLTSGKMTLCKAAEDAIQHSHSDNISIDADSSQLKSLDELDLVLLAQKAVGFLFLWPITASSFVISLMRIGAIEPLKQLLLDPLLLNYTGSVRELLQARAEVEAEPVAEALRECIERIDAYLAEIHTAIGIRELRPSSEHRAIFHKTLTQKLSKSFEAARKSMPLLSLIKRSIVLHGRGSVQQVVHHEGSTHRADMKVGTYGNEFTLPRMTHIDELGLHLELRLLRAGKIRK